MDVTLLFDHRFYRDGDGVVFSLKNYDYSFFADRYLRVFDRIRIVARISDIVQDRKTHPAVGDGVEVVSAGSWTGLAEFLRNSRTVLSTVNGCLLAGGAVIMIVPGLLGTLAQRQLRMVDRPYAVEVVGDPNDAFAPGAIRHPLRPFLRWWFVRQLKQQCAEACAAAYVTREALQRRYHCLAYSAGVSDVKISDADLVCEPRSFHERADGFTVVSVGSLANLHKALDVLIRAIAICVRQGLDIHLVLVGDGECRPRLETQVGALGLHDRVTFRGQVPPGDAVRAQLDQADLFVLPSRAEGLPRAMVEAMGRGLPCIGSTVGGIPELLPVDDLVRPGDANALADKIYEVLGDPDRMALMSVRNLRRAKEYHEAVLQEQRTAFYMHVQEQTEMWLRQP